MTLITRRLNVDATSWRCIDVEPTLYKSHVPAGMCPRMYKSHVPAGMCPRMYKSHVPAGMCPRMCL